MPRYKRLTVQRWQTEVWLGCFGEPVPLESISSTLRAVDPVSTSTNTVMPSQILAKLWLAQA